MSSNHKLRVASNLQLVESTDDRALARRLIQDTIVDSDEQQQVVDKFLTFIESNEDCLLRTCAPGHLTASACVVDPGRNETLLLLHKKLRRWLQPGGHADGDGNLAHVAWREALEETGIKALTVLLPAIDLDIHLIPETSSEPAHLHYDLRFAVLTQPHTSITPNDESTDADWLNPNDPKIIGNDDIERLVTRTFALLESSTVSQ